ncbi:MAG: hypothetical protein HN623_08335 [Bdellovibrionales bacterium]|jgi:hypothetical protein|nr:hypothetical protein [Bdellovibrionales bacterium]
MPVKRAFDAIKDLPELLRILTKRDFTWRKFSYVAIAFITLGFIIFFSSPSIYRYLTN